MDAIIATVEIETETMQDDLLTSLEKLTDVELAQIGGGQGIFVF